MKLFKSTIINILNLVAVFIALSFAFLPQPADACGINLEGNTFRFRTSANTGGAQPDGWFTEANKPFVYVDFKREGECVSGDSMYLTIFGLDSSGLVKKTIENQAINVASFDQNGGMTLSFKADEGPCFGNNANTTSNANCFIFAVITDLPTDNSNSTILGLLGNLIAGINNAPNVPPNQSQFSQAQTFAHNFGGNGIQPTPGCANSGTYFYRTTQNCPLDSYNSFNGLFSKQKLVDYYNAHGGSYTLMEPIVSGYGASVFIDADSPPAASLAYPALTYKCEGTCSSASYVWTAVGGALPYGSTHPNDNGPVIVNPLNDIYQTEYVPLAQLPFEGLNGGTTPSLGEYLASIFKMAIVVTAILAVLMIVFHGIAYATTGAIGKKDDHREGVKNAILGLILALGSWLLLNTISPRLASQLSIGIPEVILDGDAESISTSPITDSQGTITAFQLPNNMNLYCPGGGGSSEIPQIIDSFNNKVTYRWGGKGGGLPSGGQFKLSPNEQNGGAYMCTNGSGQSVPCRNFCPDNSVCLDCSGFVNHVRQCAGLSIYSGTSSMVTNSDAISVDMKTLSSNGQSLTVNGSNYTLQPGDLLFYKGHVVIYYGNGVIAESKGDLASIKNANQNIKKTNLNQSSYRKKITHLIKVNP